MVIHPAIHKLGRNAASLSFVAFKGPNGVDPDLSKHRSKLSVRRQMPNGRTEIIRDIEVFKGMGTSVHRRHH
jgi:hypothetical protein